MPAEGGIGCRQRRMKATAGPVELGLVASVGVLVKSQAILFVQTSHPPAHLAEAVGYYFFRCDLVR